MTILIATVQVPFIRGGAEIHAEGLRDALRDAGHETEILAIRPSKSKPTHGIVKLRSTARNQHGEVVYVVTPNCWVPRRSSA